MNLSNYTKEFPYNFKLAFPVMLGQLGHVMVGFVDNLMVGRLGAAHLAAVSLGNSLVFVAMSVGIGISFAITPLIAESDGENNLDSGRLYLHHGIVLCGITGLTLFLILLLIKPLLYMLNQPPEVVDLAIPYFEMVSFSIIPLMLFQGFKQFADALSQTKYAMIAVLATNIVNIVLNFVLIYGFWVFPRLELVGAGIGTVIARVFMLLFLVYILKKKHKFRQYLVAPKRNEFRRNIFKRMFSLGFPTALQMFFEVAVFSSAILLAGTLGTHAQAANQIALNLASMAFMIAVGLGVTATIRVGNQKGKRNFVELRRIALSLFLMVIFTQTLFAIFFILFKGILPEIYIDNAEVIGLASALIIVAAIFQLSDGLQVVILGALRGLQDVKIPSVICFIAYWIIGFPICFYLGKEENFGSVGIWIGLFVGLTASAIMLYLRFTYLSKKAIRQHTIS